MINWSTVWELIKINLLYSNPQAVAAIKKKQAKNPHKHFSAYKSILRQQAFSLVMMLVLYGFLLSSINYSQAPAYLSLQIGVFSIMSSLYLIISLFSVFYDSKDTKLYLPLPIKSKDIYLAKLISSQGTGIAFLSPVIVYLTIAYWQTSPSILAPLVALVMFTILLLVNNAISLIFLSFVGKILAKSPYKKLISSVFMLIGFICAFGLYGFLQVTSKLSVTEQGQLYGFNVPYFRGFYDIYLNPFSLDSLCHFWLGLLGLAVLIGFIYKRILPNYIADSLKMDATVIIKRQTKGKHLQGSLRKTLIRHHLSGLKDTTLIMQNSLQSLLFAIMFIGPVLSGEATDFGKYIQLAHFGIVLLVGFFIGSLIATPTSFLGVGMSLERENYHFIRTLPISFRGFIQQKFWVLAFAQLFLPSLVYTALGLVLKCHPIIIAIFLIGMISATLIIGEWVYARDQRLLMLNWQNINQLFYRGGGQWLLAGMQLGIMILGLAVIILSFIASNFISPILVSSGLTLLVIAILSAIHVMIGKKFWDNLF